MDDDLSKKGIKGVTILGLNAVWQKVIPLDDLKPGSVHRTKSTSTFFSGKGGNVAVSMERLGHPNIELVQALGGESGEWVEEDMKRFEFSPNNQWILEGTRICTTLIEKGGRTTELIEPSPTLIPFEWQGVSEILEESMSHDRDILICGSFPGGDATPLIDILSQRPENIHLWVDGIREDVLSLHPNVLKINHEELAGLGSNSNNLEENCREVSQRFKIPTLIITAESKKVCLWNKDTFLEIPVPSIPKVVNTTGAGDTFFGALVYYHQKEADWEKNIESAIHWAGLRCGLDNVEDLPRQTP